jgi:polyhydroxybutyrate depolymerase
MPVSHRTRLVVIAAVLVAVIAAAGWLAGRSTESSTADAAAPRSQAAPSAAAPSTGAPSTPGASTAAPSPTPAPAPTPAAPPDWVTTTVAVAYDGLARSFVMVRPAQTSPTPLPVLVALHGCCVTPDFEVRRTGFQAVTGPAVLVYPTGYEQSWNAGTCCGAAQEAGVDDVGFITTVVRQVLASQPDAAADRVYLAGYSNGGKMALRMACAEPQLFAAVGVYAAVNAQPCPSPTPVSLLVAASSGDPEVTIPADGTPVVRHGYVTPTVAQQVADYTTTDGCSAPPASTTTGTVSLTTWTGCSTNHETEMVVYQGGNHDWPEGDAATPSLQTVMWSFFTSANGAVPARPVGALQP